MKKKMFKLLVVTMACIMMLGAFATTCFAATATYDTNSANYNTSERQGSGYTTYFFEDHTYYLTTRILAAYSYSNKMSSIVRIETGATPQYTQFNYTYGQTVKYNLFGSHQQGNVSGIAYLGTNDIFYTAESTMQTPYSSNWNVKKLISEYVCQPAGINDNHNCEITIKL